MIGKDTGQGRQRQWEGGVWRTLFVSCLQASVVCRNLEIETVGEQSTEDTIHELPERGGRSSKSVIDMTSDGEEGRRFSFA